jgi:hypothetical protein
LELIGLTPEDEAALARMLRDYEAGRLFSRSSSSHLEMPRVYEAIPFVNGSGETIPPYAVMRLTTPTTVDGEMLVTATKPSSTSQRLYLVNGQDAVEDSATARGWGTWVWDSDWVLYDTTDTPTVGDEWGAKEGEWKLFKNRTGFLATGQYDATEGRMKAVQLPFGSSTPEEGIPFVNLGGRAMLPHDPMAVFDTIMIGGVLHLWVQEPTTQFQTQWLINGPDIVPFYTGVGDISVATSRGFWRTEKSGPVAIYPAAASLVFPGLEMGVSPHVQRLDPHYPGFISLGEPRTANGSVVVDAVQRRVTTVFGKTRFNPNSGPNGESGGSWYQNAAGTTTAQFEIWIRGNDGKRRPAGYYPIETYLTYLGKGESVKPGTWGRADNYTHDSLRWEGDFTCDPDSLDSSQQGGGQGGGDQGGGGGGGGGPQQLAEFLESSSLGMGTGTY